ncbi:MAG: bifunctional phosphoribosylaminoimidazolecarboxamide formyltransferase/IMP cyclohydrolase, partial [Phycisphaerales bacterium]|nr:bifunctional phosphoribosylaminoimidazolecarboxamide formyltransferase/IMP cyclohydrolase [Phycisphaerales bacterium]
GDPLAAYGGILAVNVPVDDAIAKRLVAEGTFLEVLVAPSYSESALETLRTRWNSLRILAVGEKEASSARKLDHRSVPGGLLVQDRDTMTPTPARWQHAAGPAPTAEQLDSAAFLEVVCKACLSNAVVVGGRDGRVPRVFGVGGGQVDRLNSCRIAVAKAGELARGGVAVSDAFFPFGDGPQVLIDAGVTMIVHPGGSKRDDETFEHCRRSGVTCMTTGTRHFRH